MHFTIMTRIERNQATVYVVWFVIKRAGSGKGDANLQTTNGTLWRQAIGKGDVNLMLLCDVAHNG